MVFFIGSKIGVVAAIVSHLEPLQVLGISLIGTDGGGPTCDADGRIDVVLSIDSTRSASGIWQTANRSALTVRQCTVYRVNRTYSRRHYRGPKTR